MVCLWRLGTEEEICPGEEEDESGTVQGRVESVSDMILICRVLERLC